MFNYLDILPQRKHQEIIKYRKETEMEIETDTERNVTEGVCINMQ